MSSTTEQPAAVTADVTFVVRDATPSDIPEIVRMQVAMAFESEQLELDPAVVTRGVTRPFEAENVARYFVCDAVATSPDGPAPRVAGVLMITYEWSDWRNGCVYWIQSVYTHPEFRRRGVFKGLYAHVKALALSDDGCAGLRLYVEHDNTRAMATYAALGMEAEHYTMMKDMKGVF